MTPSQVYNALSPCLLLQAKSAYMYFVQDKLKEIKVSAPGLSAIKFSSACASDSAWR